MSLSPLERRYPMRCYDCLSPLSGTDVALGVLCSECRGKYQAERERRRKERAASGGPNDV